MSAEPIASRGHGDGRFRLTVRVSESAREAYRMLGPTSEVPEGALVAAFHRDGQTGQLGPVYVMEHRGQNWSYAVYDAEGYAMEQGVQLCERCHLESPTGGLFGLPKTRDR